MTRIPEFSSIQRPRQTEDRPVMTVRIISRCTPYTICLSARVNDLPRKGPLRLDRRLGWQVNGRTAGAERNTVLDCSKQRQQFECWWKFASFRTRSRMLQYSVGLARAICILTRTAYAHRQHSIRSDAKIRQTSAEIHYVVPGFFNIDMGMFRSFSVHGASEVAVPCRGSERPLTIRILANPAGGHQQR